MKTRLAMVLVAVILAAAVGCEPFPSVTPGATIVQTTGETPGATEAATATAGPTEEPITQTPTPTAVGPTAPAPTTTPTPTPQTYIADGLVPWPEYVRQVVGWDGGIHWVEGGGWVPLYYDLADCRTMEQAWGETLPSCRMCEPGQPEVGCTPLGESWSLWHTPEFASSRCYAYPERCRSGAEAQRIFFQNRLGYAGIQYTAVIPVGARECHVDAYVMAWHTDDADVTGGHSRITVTNDDGSVNEGATNDARESMWARLVAYPYPAGARAESGWYGWDDNGTNPDGSPICQLDGHGNCGYGLYDRWEHLELDFNPNGKMLATISVEVTPTFADHNQDFHIDDVTVWCEVPIPWEPTPAATPDIPDATPTQESWEPIGQLCVPATAAYSLNVRAEPGAQYDVIGGIPPGSCVDCYHLTVYSDSTPRGWESCTGCEIWCALTQQERGYSALLYNHQCLAEYYPVGGTPLIISGDIGQCLP